jgi:hypothetical protein
MLSFKIPETRDRRLFLITSVIFLWSLQLRAQQTSLEPPGSTSAERQLLAQGPDIDLWPDHKHPDKLCDGSWTEEQKITSEILRRKIDDAIRAKPEVEVIKISGAWFFNGLNLRNISLPSKLEFESCKIDGPLEFSNPSDKQTNTMSRSDIVLTRCFGDNLKTNDFDAGSFQIVEGQWSRQIQFYYSRLKSIELLNVDFASRRPDPTSALRLDPGLTPKSWTLKKCSSAKMERAERNEEEI